MVSDLKEFRQQAIKHGICEMLHDWDNAKSKKQIMDVALHIRGIEFIAKSYVDGFGILPSFIEDYFKPFKNGKYISQQKGYTSSFYCSYDKDININTTATLIISHHGNIIIPKPYCEIYLVNSKVNILGEGKGKINLYDSEIINNYTSSVICK